MANRIWSGLVVAVLACGMAAAGDKAKVTYIANEGFLVEAGSSTILFDAIFDDRTISYAHVPGDGTLEMLATAGVPFDDVDLLLVTHDHRDHFSVVPVIDHLKANPSAVFIAPPSAVRLVEIVEPDFERLGLDVRAAELDLFEAESFAVGSIRVTAIRLRHSPYMETDPDTGEQVDRHAHVENLAYVVEAAGLTMLHVGDATLSHNLDFFEKGLFEKREFDLVFLEFFDWSDKTKEILDRWMTPRHTVFMHLPPELEKIRTIESRLQQNFPNAVVFREPLESRDF